MKKFLIATCVLLSACGSVYQVPAEVSDNLMGEHYQVLYSPAGHYWNNGGMVEDRIVWTKHISSGSGGYSEYTTADYPMLDLPTVSEFIFHSRFYGYNPYTFKFYEAVYQNKKFIKKELGTNDIAEIFSDVEIIKVSDAKGNTLTIRKKPFETKSFLIVNDTDRDFYKYSFETPVKTDENFKSLITVSDFGEYIFSHYGSREKDFPILKIDVKM